MTAKTSSLGVILTGAFHEELTQQPMTSSATEQASKDPSNCNTVSREEQKRKTVVIHSRASQRRESNSILEETNQDGPVSTEDAESI